jgi:hypothetical protein
VAILIVGFLFFLAYLARSDLIRAPSAHREGRPRPYELTLLGLIAFLTALMLIGSFQGSSVVATAGWAGAGLSLVILVAVRQWARRRRRGIHRT